MIIFYLIDREEEAYFCYEALIPFQSFQICSKQEKHLLLILRLLLPKLAFLRIEANH